jgi:TonB-dependent receptor
MRKAVLFLILLTTSVFAADGSLSLYVLKDGKPLAKQNAVIYKLPLSAQEGAAPAKAKRIAELATDAEGYLGTALPAGEYQLRLLATEKGTPQAFLRKNFTITPKKETQIILSLTSDNALAFSDTEAPKTQAQTKTPAAKHETGSVALTLRSSDNGKPVAGARIFVAGMNVSAVSDKNGQAVIDLPDGNQTLSIIHTDFAAQTLKVDIRPKEMVSRSVELSPASMELEEFVVLAPHVEGSVASVIAQERDSDAVGNVLGAEQFKKSGDDDAASALRRASGLTIVGGKYVYVRGLGDRYSTVLFNNLNVPSPNPTKRVVPLDIFPTSAIKSITIQKSYTADLPGNFGGGTILIDSIDIPEDEGFVKASVRIKSTNGTGKKANQNPDPGVEIPGSVIAASNNFNEIYSNGSYDPQYVQDMVNYRSYNRKNGTLPPGYKLSLSGGKSFETERGWRFGATGSLYYQNDNNYRDISYDKYMYNGTTGEHQLEEIARRGVTSFDEQYGGLVSVGANYKDEQKIKYTLFTTTQNLDLTTTGMTTFVGDATPYDLTYYESYISTIMLHQLNGEHHLRFSDSTDGFFDDLLLSWAAETGEATRKEPGSVEYQYDYLYQAPTLNKKIWYYYGDLNDEVTNYRADFTLPFVFNMRDNYTKLGAFVYHKKRNFDNRRYKMQHDYANNDPILEEPIDSILNEQNIDHLTFTTNYRPADAYKATQDVNAFYLTQMLSVMESLDVVASVRYETSKQELVDSESGDPYAPLETEDWFPGIGLTYRINDEMQLRLGYSNTITRPDFREFSPNRYKDPVTGDIVFGYPDLKPTYINNVDLKYEWYMSPGEMFSFALFGKEFKNPIETVQSIDVQSDASTLIVSYRNAKSATSYGAELDMRKRFGFIGDAWQDLLFATNVALIQSKVNISRDPNDQMLAHLTTTDRPMMGQSPYVVNVALGYDSVETGNSSLLLFNQIGERLVSLGTYGNADKYEQPFAKLDFVTKWNLNNNGNKSSALTYGVKFKATNLLDSEVKVTQAGNKTFYYKPGSEYSLTFSVEY